jgi:3-dehydro-L-gulonate-6-phosphate decarboxylase
MSIPLLQVALDNTSLEDAILSIHQYGDLVDIVEVGTILHVAEGVKATQVMRKLYPNKLILDDIKGADAGHTLAKLCFNAGADIMTAICSADVHTMTAMKEAGGPKKTVQVELYGDWTYEQAQQWLDHGIDQVVYHRSRDAELAGKTWGQDDFNKIEVLCHMGFKVTITGGLGVQDLKLFKDYPIYAVIGGRSIRDAKDPRQAALEFKQEIQRLWQ